MSRPIRFRAWDKKKRKMFPVDIESMDAGIMPVKSNWEDTIHPFDADVCELMQYTGLKDRQGKEIWEGDIVKSEDFYLGDSYHKANNGKVIWGDGCFMVEEIGDEFVSRELDSTMVWNYHIEVIGNCFETPGLLEGVKK